MSGIDHNPSDKEEKLTCHETQASNDGSLFACGYDSADSCLSRRHYVRAYLYQTLS
jgi:hypothetical protein